MRDTVNNLLSDHKKLEHAYSWFLESYNKLKDHTTFNIPSDIDQLELFASRYQRVIEIFIQKLSKDIYDFENLNTTDESTVTIRDRMNFMEKIGLIENVDMRMESKDLRNKLAHDYLFEELEHIYEAIIKNYLIHITNLMKHLQSYIEKIKKQ